MEVQLFPDRLEIWNPGTLHPPLTLEKLYHPHASQPNNPLIAEPLFLTKYIEKAGTGTVDMLERCRAAGMRQPEFCTDAGFFILTVWRKIPDIGSGPSRDPVGTQSGPSRDQVTAQVKDKNILLIQQSLRELADAMGLTAAQVTAQVTAQVETLLAAVSNEAMSREELQAATGIRHREHFRKAYIEPLVASGWIQRTIPDKPTSRLQKYRLTDKGSAWLAGTKPGRM